MSFINYRYVDPDGIRREFTYVSGNPCDPNDPNKEEEEEQQELDEESIPSLNAGIRSLIRRPVNVNADVGQGLEQTVEERVPENQLPALFNVARRWDFITVTYRLLLTLFPKFFVCGRSIFLI